MFVHVCIQDTDECCAVVMELKLKALILDTVHSIEVLKTLISEGVTDVSSWHWQKQLRFYLRNGQLHVNSSCCYSPRCREFSKPNLTH